MLVVWDVQEVSKSCHFHFSERRVLLQRGGGARISCQKLKINEHTLAQRSLVRVATSLVMVATSKVMVKTSAEKLVEKV